MPNLTVLRWSMDGKNAGPACTWTLISNPVSWTITIKLLITPSKMGHTVLSPHHVPAWVPPHPSAPHNQTPHQGVCAKEGGEGRFPVFWIPRRWDRAICSCTRTAVFPIVKHRMNHCPKSKFYWTGWKMQRNFMVPWSCLGHNCWKVMKFKKLLRG